MSGQQTYIDLDGYVRDVIVGQSFAEQVGFRLKVARLAVGLTQQEVGEGIGISRVAVARYEAGHRQPDAVMLAKLAQLLGVDVGRLLSA